MTAAKTMTPPKTLPNMIHFVLHDPESTVKVTTSIEGVEPELEAFTFRQLLGSPLTPTFVPVKSEPPEQLPDAVKRVIETVPSFVSCSTSSVVSSTRTSLPSPRKMQPLTKTWDPRPLKVMPSVMVKFPSISIVVPVPMVMDGCETDTVEIQVDPTQVNADPGEGSGQENGLHSYPGAGRIGLS